MFDLFSDKIPNWYLVAAFVSLLVQKFFFFGETNFIETILSVLFPVLILFPLFALGLFGGADIKIIGLTGVCFSFKEVMLIFVISLFWGLLTGLIKALSNRSFFERFKMLYLFSKNIFYKALLKKGDLFEQPYLESMDKDTLKKGSIHYSLPILLAVVTKLILGG